MKFLNIADRCVGKEWIFQCIIEGKILPVTTTGDQDICQSSGDESTVLEFPALDKVIVQTSGKSKGKKRTGKKQCCVYCEKMDLKISRHMEIHHRDESEVAKILCLQKGSKERKNAWGLLAAKGNNLHNLKVREEGVGILIPKYRQSASQNTEKYLSCEFCRGLFVQTDLWKHHNSCVARPDGVKSDAPSLNSRLLLPIPKTVSEDFNRCVLMKIRDDVIGRKAKTDSLIQEFGQRLYEKSSKYEHTHSYIACRMRELARFVLAVQKINTSLNTLQKCIDPTLWSTLIKAIKEEAGFSSERKTFVSPSFAQKVGYSLKKCASILKTQAAEANDYAAVERMKIFIEMYLDEYDERISSLARDSLSTAQYNNVKYLPIVEDVVKLSTFLEKEILALMEMKSPEDKEFQYSSLCKLVLAQIILFNRKRSGEAARLKKDAFIKCCLSNDMDPEVERSLTKFEKHLCKTHLRVETRGKRGRKIAILLTKSMKKNIEFLIELQNVLNIQSSEVFCRPRGTKPYRGNDVLKEAALKANLKHVDRISSTGLRKQLATMCQVLNLAENNQDILASFMGHDIRIHRQYYRLPQGTLEKVSKVLHLLNSGKISTMAGANFDNINVQGFIGNYNFKLFGYNPTKWCVFLWVYRKEQINLLVGQSVGFRRA